MINNRLLSLKLHPRAQGVDVGRDSGILLIDGQLIKGLRRFQFGLCRIDAGFVRNGKQIIRADRQHHGVARIVDS